MKTSLIVLMVLSLSLVGSFSNSYAEVGDFIVSFDGSDGDKFTDPYGVAVDNNNRIIIIDPTLGLVQIFDSEGVFLDSFDGTGNGGTEFSILSAVAVDNNNKIIVIDVAFGEVQIYESNGAFISSFDGSGNGGTKFLLADVMAVDNNNRILVVDSFNPIIQIFNSEGVFLDSFDGTGNGGTKFVNIKAIAVDNNNRILVGDSTFDLVQIFNSEGVFLDSFDGTGNDSRFKDVTAIAVDDNNRIIVGDVIRELVQIFDSEGVFIDSFDGSDGGGTEFGVLKSMAVVNNRIIVGDSLLGIVQIFEGFTPVEVPTGDEPTVDEPVKKSGSGGCGDCVPPTLGLNDDNKRLVDNGFSYNGNLIQVERWHTPYQLITATVGEINIVEITVYENQGINNMKLVQFGLGATEIGESINDLEVVIEVWLETFGLTDEMGIKEIIIIDKNNLIESSTVAAAANVVKCTTSSQDEVCVKVTLEYSYREPTINNVMLVNVMDKARNSQNFYFNDGVEVIGDSMNPSPTYKIFNQKSNQQTENLWLNLVRTDKVNHIWMDENGIEYLQVSESRFDRITPTTSIIGLDGFKINKDPLQSVQSRVNSNFDVIVHYEMLRAVQHFDSSLIQGTLGDYTAMVVPVHDINRLEKLGDNIDVEQVKAQEIIYDLMNPIMIYR